MSLYEEVRNKCLILTRKSRGYLFCELDKHTSSLINLFTINGERIAQLPLCATPDMMIAFYDYGRLQYERGRNDAINTSVTT